MPFPICGSLNQGRYTFDGREYALPVHGFAKTSLFRSECAPDGASATFTLESDDATRAVYPFDFALAITFRLDGRTLFVEALVTNRCDAVMPFAYGGHPGEMPFLCIEPWTGMPSVVGVPDDLAVRPDMIRLSPGEATMLGYSIEFK